MSYYNNQNQGPPPPPGGGGGYGYGGGPPQGGYPPQNGYPAPQQQQGHPQQGYQQSGYQQPPPPGPPGGGYSQPPQHGGYGSAQGGGYQQPPHGQQPYGGGGGGYGAPPPPQHNAAYGGAPVGGPGGYGQPPHAGHGPGQSAYGSTYPSSAPVPGAMNGNVIGANIYLGVPIPAPPPAPPITPASLPGYDATFDASRLRSATKGFGTDEKTLITVLTSLDAYQIDLLTRVFEGSYGKSLSKTLESELSGDLEYGLVLLSQGPLAGDIWLMNRACKGMGTHEDLLCEVLLNRTNWEMWALKEGYKRVYGKDLVQVVKGELSMKTERLFIMALAGTRDESPQVNHQLVEQDMNTLYKSGEGRLGTDEIAICSILTQRSDAHLLALSQAYTSRHRHTLTQAIGKEFSGHMREGLHLIARAHENPNASVELDAELLEDAMDGVGTKDERLIYRVVRGHWNRPRWEGVKSAYKRMYGKELSKRIKGETTGKYETFLVAMC